MNTDTISVPTREGWLFTERVWGPKTTSQRHRVYTATFEIRKQIPRGRGQERCMSMGVAGQWLRGKGWPDDKRTALRIVEAVAPHLVICEINSPGDLAKTEDCLIKINEWLNSSRAAAAGLDALAEALDGGKAEYNRLCREDVLRILLNHYEEAGPCSALSHEEIAGSPLKRRYYGLQPVRFNYDYRQRTYFGIVI